MMNSKILITQFQNQKFNDKLSEIYFNDTEQLHTQNQRYISAIKKFEQTFGEEDIEIYSAPGRTEIGGNHTDHQNGMVLAASIHLDTVAIVSANDKHIIEILSEGYNLITIDLNNLTFKKEESETTAALVKGVIVGMKKRGYNIGPFKAYITSNVPIGSGLSSSAAFETIIGTIISGMYNDMKISPVEIAIIAQYAENIYFGKPCGLMDQMACSVGGLIHIDFLHPKNPVVEKINFNLQDNGYSLCIVDTKGSHADLTPDYAAIPAEMKAVSNYFGKEVLTEIDEKFFYEKLPEIRAVAGDRAVLRAIHFYNENKRVQREVDALKMNSFDKFLEVFQSSGNSSFKYLQNVYSNRDLNNQSVSIALAISENILGDNGACRIHGGGFAGTIQVFIKNNFVSEYKEKIEKILGKDTCHILKIRKCGGIRIV